MCGIIYYINYLFFSFYFMYGRRKRILFNITQHIVHRNGEAPSTCPWNYDEGNSHTLKKFYHHIIKLKILKFNKRILNF